MTEAAFQRIRDARHAWFVPLQVTFRKIGDFAVPDASVTLNPFHAWIAEHATGFAHAMISIADGEQGVIVHLENETDYRTIQESFPQGRGQSAAVSEDKDALPAP